MAQEETKSCRCSKLCAAELRKPFAAAEATNKSRTMQSEYDL
ncbi:hypothetical protein SS05631_c35400 [Sinorhizobium sp. CCBAU 05631]|nr:hypothetical protein SS05631_c35400 [Sinorhizobium sp. CCBAU 05631]